jgi:predicted MFS family arabinose efflux permease
MSSLRKAQVIGTFVGIGAATAAAHIGNNFTTYLVGGLIDRFGFTPFQMGLWSMAETLAYALAMFIVAPRVARLNPRLLASLASVLVILAQALSVTTGDFTWLLLGRIATGLGFGLLNTSLNLAAGSSAHPARAISFGIGIQTLLYAALNIGLPVVGARFGVNDMFLSLAAVSIVLWLGTLWLPTVSPADSVKATDDKPRLGAAHLQILAAMALFTFGSLAIWPFMERAAHAIGLSAVAFGRYQSLATLLAAGSSLTLAAIAGKLPRAISLAFGLLACGVTCAILTTVQLPAIFGGALIVYNVTWFITYAFMLGLAFAIEPGGRLAVLTTATWLLSQSLGAVVAGAIAQVTGGYTLVGPLGLVFCAAAIALTWPLARRFDRQPIPDAVPVTH